MKTIKQLRERNAEVLKRMSEMLDVVQKEHRFFSKEEEREWQILKIEEDLNRAEIRIRLGIKRQTKQTNT